MYSGERSGALIGNQDRHTVGSLNGKQGPGNVRAERIAGNGLRAGIVEINYDAHVGRVDLPSGDQSPVHCVERSQEASAIFNHIRAFILPEVAETERVIWQRADAAEPCAECVLESCSLERRADNPPQSFPLAGFEVRYDHWDRSRHNRNRTP